MVSITGLLVADGLGTVLPVVLLLVLVGLCRAGCALNTHSV